MPSLRENKQYMYDYIMEDLFLYQPRTKESEVHRKKEANIACTTTVVKCKSLLKGTMVKPYAIINTTQKNGFADLMRMHGVNRRWIYLSPLVLSSLVYFFVDHQLPIYLDMLVAVTSSVYNVAELLDHQLVIRQFFLISPLLPVLTSSAASLLSE
jgi:hypothetical protein